MIAILFSPCLVAVNKKNRVDLEKMNDEIKDSLLDKFKPSKTSGNVKTYGVFFRNDYASFVNFILAHPKERRSPIVDLDVPVDRFGMKLYKDCVRNVSECFIAPCILVTHIETDGSEVEGGNDGSS